MSPKSCEGKRAIRAPEEMDQKLPAVTIIKFSHCTALLLPGDFGNLTFTLLLLASAMANG